MFCSVASAQDIPLAQPKIKSIKKILTVIKADMINIDIAKNFAVFTGNVKFDDGETAITCRKMTVFLEDKKTGYASSEEGKQISRIFCEGEVVVVTKAQDESGKAGDDHKAK